jgi:hypothetical protein
MKFQSLQNPKKSTLNDAFSEEQVDFLGCLDKKKH